MKRLHFDLAFTKMIYSEIKEILLPDSVIYIQNLTVRLTFAKIVKLSPADKR